MSQDSALVYVHEPVAPFQRVAGAIGVSGVQKNRGLSQDSSASFTVASNQVELSWLQPGMCWLLDQTHIGEEIWAGFVAPQVVPLDAPEIPVQLIGPKQALLQQPLVSVTPRVIAVVSAVKVALQTAQAQGSPMLEGTFNDVGLAFELTISGETASQFISSMQQISKADYLVNVEQTKSGLSFTLDFGIIEDHTGVVLTRDDIVAGEFVAQRIPSTMTAFGAAEVFSERERVTLSPDNSAIGSGQQTVLQADSRYGRLITERAIGPGAIIHVNQVDDRFREGFAQIALQRHESMLRQVEQFLFTLRDNANTRKVKVGDVITLSVKKWFQGKTVDLDVESEVHVRSITPDDATGLRDVVTSKRF